MFVVRHLKRGYYAIFESNSRITWTYIRTYATHFDNKDFAEDTIKEKGLERDDYAIIKVNGR